VFKEPEHELVHDFAVLGEKIKIAAGGRGGRGNAQFATSTNQAPRHTEPGAEGEQFELSLNLKLIADVGLVGFPNVGKSTLISRISAAKPKIADYPFTTLSPNLGVVKVEEYRTFVVADVPGLIEGAHEGHGLGDQFLKHIERTKVLAHLIDVSNPDRDPLADYKAIVKELGLFNKDLLERKQLIIASKIDALADPRHISRLKAMCSRRKLPFLCISAVTGEGIKELIYALDSMLRSDKEEIS
jgi:GTP-binding protein